MMKHIMVKNVKDGYINRVYKEQNQVAKMDITIHIRIMLRKVMHIQYQDGKEINMFAHIAVNVGTEINNFYYAKSIL